jgi:hypothetical protein
MPEHPSLIGLQQSKSQWEQEEREWFSAQDLRADFQQALYTQQGRELLADAEIKTTQDK